MDIRPEAVTTTGKPQSSELQGRNELFSPERTLGYGALEANSRVVLHMHEFRTSAITPDRHEALSKQISIDTIFQQNDLDHARTALTMHTGPKGDMVERYLSGINTPDIDAAVKKQETLKGTPMTWRQWIARHATDDELMHLLRQHTDVLLQHARSDEIAADIDALQDIFMKHSNRLYEAGYFAAIPRDPSEVLLRYGDIFDTALKDRAGYYQPATEEVVLGQGYQTHKEGHVAEARKELPRVILHEWAHALIGRAYRMDPFGAISERWFNEGMTEEVYRLISRLSKNSIPEVENRVYETERTFIADLIAPTKHPHEMRRLLFRAYSGDEDDRDILLEEVDALWHTKDVIEKISREVSLQEGVLAIVAARVQARSKGLDPGSVKPKLPSAKMQADALRTVQQNFYQDPQTVLRKEKEAYADQLQAAAQESKK